jgi:MoaA/NifB/PqqE/SkfB family radical SAM enzyme
MTKNLKKDQFKCGYISGSIWIGSGATTILPCCFTDNKNKPGYSNLAYKSLINHPVLVDIRQEANQGKVHELCNMCVKKEKDGLKSARLKSNTLFKNKGNVKVNIDYNDLEQIYLSLSNICNYKCVICSSGQSHLIAKEEKLKNPLKMISDKDFDKLLEIIKEANNLQYFQVSGGEPFQHKARLKKVLNNITKNVNFYMHTNGSIFDDEVIEICKIMEGFKSAIVSFSIDGHRESFEYQRTNGVWTEVFNNIKKFNQIIDTNKVFPTNNYTVTCFNLLDIQDFIENYHPYFHKISFHELTSPSAYHIRMLTEEHLIQTQIKLKTFYHNLSSDIKNKIYLEEIFVAIKSALNNPPDKETIDEFWRKAEYMNKIRGISLEEKLPHLLEHFRKTHG